MRKFTFQFLTLISYEMYCNIFGYGAPNIEKRRMMKVLAKHLEDGITKI